MLLGNIDAADVGSFLCAMFRDNCCEFLALFMMAHSGYAVSSELG